MGFFGGKPNAWTDEQWDRFCDEYDNLTEGKFGVLDAIPPTNLAALGGKVAMLSIKGMVAAGDKSVYALKVEKLHYHLQSMTFGNVKDHWMMSGYAEQGFRSKFTPQHNFFIICALHVTVYGSL